MQVSRRLSHLRFYTVSDPWTVPVPACCLFLSLLLRAPPSAVLAGEAGRVVVSAEVQAADMALPHLLVCTRPLSGGVCLPRVALPVPSAPASPPSLTRASMGSPSSTSCNPSQPFQWILHTAGGQIMSQPSSVHCPSMPHLLGLRWPWFVLQRRFSSLPLHPPGQSPDLSPLQALPEGSFTPVSTQTHDTCRRPPSTSPSQLLRSAPTSSRSPLSGHQPHCVITHIVTA